MRGQRKNPRKAVQPFENKKRKIDIFKNYEANGVEKIQRKLEIFSTLISKKSITVAEMFFQAQRIAGRTYETMAVYIEVAIIYLIFSTILEYIQRRGEKKLGKYGSN